MNRGENLRNKSNLIKNETFFKMVAIPQIEKEKINCYTIKNILSTEKE